MGITVTPQGTKFATTGGLQVLLGIGADFVLRLTFKFPRNFFKFAFFSSRADW